MSWPAGPRAILPTILVAATVLAGCTSEPDRVHESYVVSVVADELFQIQFPLVLYDEGLTGQQWSARFYVSLGHGNLTLGPGGKSIVLESDRTVHVEAQHRETFSRCCNEAYLQGTWSQPAGDQISIHTTAGSTGTVSIRYNAENASCWREANFFAAATDVGVTEMQGHDQQECT